MRSSTTLSLRGGNRCLTEITKESSHLTQGEGEEVLEDGDAVELEGGGGTRGVGGHKSWA